MPANILPGTTMEIYWSDAVTLKNRQVLTVVATSEPVVFAKRISPFVILTSIPAASITPPKIMAVSISHIVFSIPAMPPVLRRSLTWASLVITAILPYMLFITAMYEAWV